MSKTEKDIRLIVCDIDNTIIPSGREEISERLRTDFHKAIEKGIHVMIDTGRHYTFLQKSLFEDLPMEYIGTVIDRVIKLASLEGCYRRAPSVI